jgi:hypothetical protein
LWKTSATPNRWRPFKGEGLGYKSGKDCYTTPSASVTGRQTGVLHNILLICNKLEAEGFLSSLYEYGILIRYLRLEGILGGLSDSRCLPITRERFDELHRESDGMIKTRPSWRVKEAIAPFFPIRQPWGDLSTSGLFYRHDQPYLYSTAFLQKSLALNPLISHAIFVGFNGLTQKSLAPFN